MLKNLTEPARPKPRSDVAEGAAQHVIDSRRLFYFFHVARLGGLTGAEAYLDIAQSAISRQILQLETDLGVQLLRRTGRGMALTEVGTLVYERAQIILGEMLETYSEIDLAVRQPSGQISIAAPYMFIRGFMCQVLERFSATYPDVHLRVLEASTGQVADLLAAGHVDLAVRPARTDFAEGRDRGTAARAHGIYSADRSSIRQAAVHRARRTRWAAVRFAGKPERCAIIDRTLLQGWRHHGAKSR